MKRTAIALMAAFTMVQNIAYADLTDLPNPNDSTYNQQRQNIYGEYGGSVQVTAMSRASNGTRYVLDLEKPVMLKKLQITVERNRLKIHSASVVTTAGRLIEVLAFKDSEAIDTGATLYSENLNLRTQIVRIEIVAESFVGQADAVITAVSEIESPVLSLRPVKNVYPYAPMYEGDVVMYNFMTPVTIEAIYGNNLARVRLSDGNVFEVHMQLLSSKITCFRDFCERDRAMHDLTTPVRIVSVYSNGRVLVRFTNGETLNVGIGSLTTCGQ